MNSCVMAQLSLIKLSPNLCYILNLYCFWSKFYLSFIFDILQRISKYSKWNPLICVKIFSPIFKYCLSLLESVRSRSEIVTMFLSFSNATTRSLSIGWRSGVDNFIIFTFQPHTHTRKKTIIIRFQHTILTCLI